MRAGILIGMLMWSAAAFAEAPVETDRASLERLAAENDAAWDGKDWAKITDQYVAGGTLRVAPAATVETGRDAIRRFFQASFSRRPDGFRHVTEIRHIEMVTPDLAIADGHVRVEKAEGSGWKLLREFSSNSLIIRVKGVWKLHSVRAYPLPPASSN